MVGLFWGVSQTMVTIIWNDRESVTTPSQPFACGFSVLFPRLRTSLPSRRSLSRLPVSARRPNALSSTANVLRLALTVPTVIAKTVSTSLTGRAGNARFQGSSNEILTILMASFLVTARRVDAVRSIVSVSTKEGLAQRFVNAPAV